MMVEQMELLQLGNSTDDRSIRANRDRQMWPVFARVLLFVVLVQAIVIFYLREFCTS